MAKYNTFIELSPHYESVVDIDSESRHPDMWQEYIVHEDMKGAIEKICDSMKYEDEDKRRSFGFMVHTAPARAMLQSFSSTCLRIKSILFENSSQTRC